MTNTQVISNLWQEMRQAINKTYADGQKKLSGDALDDCNCLRDYAENISMTDDLARLLDRETANEKQHRSNRPQVVGFSSSTAAKLILMSNVITGSRLKKIPRSTAFLVLRQTAVEAEVIGFLISENLNPAWVKAVESFDYSKLMQAS